MSYNEKLLREFVRHALNHETINEKLESSAIGYKRGAEGAELGAPAPLAYSERWGHGRGKAVRATGLAGKLFSMPQSAKDLYATMFGEYSGPGSWCTKEGGGKCPGLFPSIIGTATNWGRKILDVLFNTANPPSGTSKAAERFGASLFPTLRSYYTNPTPARSPLSPSLTECNTLFEVSLLLEQDPAAAAGLVSAVSTDLLSIENLVNSLRAANDLLDLLSMWQTITGDTSGTQELSSVISAANDGAGLLDSDFGPGGVSSVINEFVNSIAQPFLTNAVAAMRDQLVNTGLPPNVESSIRSAFDSTIRKIS